MELKFSICSVHFVSKLEGLIYNKTFALKRMTMALKKCNVQRNFSTFRAGVPNPAPGDRLSCTVHLKP